MPEQLSLFGILPDQNSFQSELWGTLDFFPTNSDKWTDNCRHCLLWTREHGQTDECLRAPCNPDERNDHRRGYFSIHQMPHDTTKYPREGCQSKTRWHPSQSKNSTFTQ